MPNRQSLAWKSLAADGGAGERHRRCNAAALLRLSDEADGGTLISLAQDQLATDFALVRDGTPERRRRSPVRRRMLFFSLRASLIVAALLWSIPTAWSGDIRVGFIDPTGPPQFWLPVSAVMQAAAAELGIDVDIRYHERSHDKSIAIAKDFLGERPPPDYLLATNDVGAGGEIIKLADASGVSVILLNNDLDQKDWAEYGEPRTKYRHWLGSLVPDHEGGGYGIAEAILTEAARITNTRPLKILALTGDAETPASVERVRGLKRAIGVMTQILGPNSVDLVDVRYLDWTLKTAEASVREFIKNGGPRIDALWAANDPMAIGAINALREAEYKPGKDVVVGGLNWSQDAIERVLNGEMLLTHGGHFLLGAWAMVIVRDHHDGRDFSEEDVHLQFPMGAIDLPIARHFPQIAKIDWRKVDFTRFSKIRNPALERYSFTPDAVLSQLPSTD
jgi:ABC-type sugar transport system substrate-binding protein